MTDEQLQIAKAALRDALATVDDNQSAFQRKTGVKQQTVSYWLARGLPVSLEAAPRIAAGTGIPAFRLRPDFFVPEPTSYVLPETEVVEGGAPVVPYDRCTIMKRTGGQ